MSGRVLRVATFTLLVALTSEARAQYYYQPQPQIVVVQEPGYQHDHGFMVRLALGGGYFTAPDRELDSRIFGGTFIYDAAFGGSVAPNIVLAVDSWGLYAIGPNFSQGSLTGSAPGDVAFVAGALGGGITFWVMPQNIYVSTAVGFALARVEHGGFVEAQTNLGFGFNAMIGKEWWVTPSMGLGLALQTMYMTLPDSGGRIDVFALGLNVSMSIQ